MWPGMWADVEGHVRSCRKCEERKRAYGKKTGLLVRQVQIGEPYYAVAMDCLKLPKTRHGHSEVLVVTDKATKEAWTFALRDERAGTIARKLLKMIPHTGCFAQIWSDRGKNFLSLVIDVVRRWVGAESRLSSGYHPQTNGQAERFNSTICTMLSKVVAESGDDWDEWLPMVTAAYNSAVHESTGESPFFLSHGREMRLPADVDLILPERLRPVEVYARGLVRRMHKALELAGRTGACIGAPGTTLQPRPRGAYIRCRGPRDGEEATPRDGQAAQARQAVHGSLRRARDRW